MPTAEPKCNVLAGRPPWSLTPTSATGQNYAAKRPEPLMKPVDQTLFYDPTAPADRQRGNCWSACIASLLEVPIDDVPNFVQIDVNGGENWFAHTMRFLNERGYHLVAVDPLAPGDVHYIQTGLSPRSPADGGEVHHAVIHLHGELAHDPHPDRTGVKSIDNAYGVERAA